MQTINFYIMQQFFYLLSQLWLDCTGINWKGLFLYNMLQFVKSIKTELVWNKLLLGRSVCNAASIMQQPLIQKASKAINKPINKQL